MLFYILYAATEASTVETLVDEVISMAQKTMTFSIDGAELTLSTDQIERYPQSYFAAFLRSQEGIDNPDNNPVISIEDTVYQNIKNDKDEVVGSLRFNKQHIPEFVDYLKEFFDTRTLSRESLNRIKDREIFIEFAHFVLFFGLEELRQQLLSSELILLKKIISFPPQRINLR